MRLWHILLTVMVLAVILAIARDEVGRVAIVIFFTAIGEVALGTAAILMLFRTIGAFGAARSWAAHVEAVAATACVLFLGGGSMLAVLWIGAATVTKVVR